MTPVRRSRARVALVVMAGALALVSATHAQRGSGPRSFREGSFPPQFPPDDFADDGFTICKLMYTQVRREPWGIGWLTDYPYAAVNLMIRASELTKIPVSRDANRNPHPWVVSLTDAALFQCPMIMASDVGTMGISDVEAARLREYLLKGGFLWVDDFWGEAAWDQWTRELAKALPSTQYTIEDVPLSDPIFRSMLEVKKVPQVTGIGFWRAVGGQTTSERGEETAVPHLRAIRDTHGRIMVVMTHNTDVSNSWERETEDPRYFYQFSVEGYALGINVLLYAMTH